jgi:hypothetical protein
MTNLVLIAVAIACAAYLGNRLDAVAWEIRRFRARLLGRSGPSSADAHFHEAIRRLQRRHPSSHEESTNT